MKNYIYFLCFAALFPSVLYGEIYKWTDEEGRQQFSNVKPSASTTGEVREVKVKAENFVESDKAQFERIKQVEADRASAQKARQVAADKDKELKRFKPGKTSAELNEEARRLHEARNNIRQARKRGEIR